VSRGVGRSASGGASGLGGLEETGFGHLFLVFLADGRAFSFVELAIFVGVIFGEHSFWRASCSAVSFFFAGLVASCAFTTSAVAQSIPNTATKSFFIFIDINFDFSLSGRFSRRKGGENVTRDVKKLGF